MSVDKTAGRVRKVSESNSSMNAGSGGGGLLRTELRAMKRSEYEQQLKDKEKMAAIIKHELDQEKLRYVTSLMISLRFCMSFWCLVLVGDFNQLYFYD